MNEITVSYDLSQAVRVSDGARLVAVPNTDEKRCKGCAVPYGGAYDDSCPREEARLTGCRKCRGPGTRLIIWRLKNG